MLCVHDYLLERVLLNEIRLTLDRRLLWKKIIYIHIWISAKMDTKADAYLPRFIGTGDKRLHFVYII